MKALEVLSDFNIENLVSLVNSQFKSKGIECRAHFGGVSSIYGALESKSLQAQSTDAGVLIWTLPQSVSREYSEGRARGRYSRETILDEVRVFVGLIRDLSQKYSSVFVANWHLDHNDRGLAMLDYRDEVGPRRLVLAMNEQLVLGLEGLNNVFVFDSSRWTAKSRQTFSKVWYRAKIPYDPPTFQAASIDLVAAVSALKGKSKKLIILDLDNTLWGGVVGDLGYEGLLLGGHNPYGEAFQAFQSELLALKNRGIMLAIVSKNTEAVALEAIEKNEEMVLGLSDFVSWRINWKDKAENVLDIAKEVNVGLDSIVFLDDNPGERRRVSGALPEVNVPEMPKSPMGYVSLLKALDYFDSSYIGEEDYSRSSSLVANREREASIRDANTSESQQDWLKAMEIRVVEEDLSAKNLQRAVQLLNKTNQFNLATRRLSEKEFELWSCEPNHKTLTYRVSDKFGDLGLTGIISYQREESTLYVRDFVLSCRAMGRRVEDTLLSLLVDRARSEEMDRVVFQFIPTDRNMPTKEFLDNSMLIRSEINFYEWPLNSILERPSEISVITSPPVN